MRLRSRNEVLEVMRRVGMADQVAKAQEMLPETIDLDGDERLLDRLGLSLDQIVDRLGGSAW